VGSLKKGLITVGIMDYREPVSPRTLLGRNALGFKFRTQRVQRSDHGLGTIAGSTFREMNISSLPIFSAGVSATTSAQPCRST